MSDQPEPQQAPIPISANDVLAWIKFNYGDIYADALQAVERAERSIAEKTMNRQQRRQAARKAPAKKAAAKKQ